MENAWYTTESAGTILGIDAKEVAKLCRTNKLWGYKTPENFGKWMIPEESIDLYSRLSLGDKNSLKTYSNRYSVKELKTIFEGDFPALEAAFEEDFSALNRLHIMNFLFRMNFKTVVIFPFLRNNPDVLQRLTNRYSKAFLEQAPQEPLIREILMLYFYHTEYDFTL